MKILVTGGAGFIGSHIVEALVRRGHRVRVIDNFFSGHRGNLAAVKADVEILRGDCADPAAARRSVRGIEAVFHEGAIPSVARSVAEPLRCHRANGTATLTMLLAARDAGVRRFIYASSSSVYGDTPTLPKRETMEPRPLSPYAAEKLSGEHYLRIFHRLFGLETLSLRYFNIFGPRQDPSSPYSGVISRFTTALLAGQTPVIYGDGQQSRDFTYVGNVVDANLRALTARGLDGEPVNVAAGRRVVLRALLSALARELGRPDEARHEPARAGDVKHSLADVSRARRLLGYRPRWDLEGGLKKTTAWYRESHRLRDRRSG
ncbi:MAG: LPS biosynthesis protein WbpP [Acidobacteria bacterium]|nr:MAG: LPS biosynthesis protein WbpP [Acidobacteriota bacterium]